MGGGNHGIGGIIAISGGTVEAAGGNYGAGIGGGEGGRGSNITINGGTVAATGGGWGAGIGGGEHGSGGTISISAGTITAQGGEKGAGIGGGSNGDGEDTTISGGTVAAQGGVQGAGIGGGALRAGGTVIISGGMVEATRGASSNKSDIGPGYDGTDGTVTITGGSVNCTSATDKILPQPTNGNGADIYLNTLTVGSPVLKNAAIAAGSIDGVNCSATSNAAGGVYGIKDVGTGAAGKVYFYLPVATAQKVALTANGSIYAATYTRTVYGSTETLVLATGGNNGGGSGGSGGSSGGGNDGSKPVVPPSTQLPKTGDGAGAAWLLCAAGIALAFALGKKRQGAR
ncbi:MAG: hypothetical protein LBN26_02830 [Christensenellaceae bacterium]|nr:hypothetical protein [Christensenellaceae bacterium]